MLPRFDSGAWGDLQRCSSWGPQDLAAPGPASARCSNQGVPKACLNSTKVFHWGFLED